MKQKPIEELSHDINVDTILRCLYAIKLFDEFYFKAYGKELIEKCIMQKLSKEVRANVVEFVEWVGTFDALKKTDKHWCIESQVTIEQLYEHYLKDRDRWLKNNKNVIVDDRAR